MPSIDSQYVPGKNGKYTVKELAQESDNSMIINYRESLNNSSRYNSLSTSPHRDINIWMFMYLLNKQ